MNNLIAFFAGSGIGFLALAFAFGHVFLILGVICLVISLMIP